MKTKRAFSLGFAAILALVAVIGFSACSDDSDGSSGSGTSVPSSFVGTWKQTMGTTIYTLTINSSGSWTSSFTTAMEANPSIYDLYCEYDSSSDYLYLYVSYSGTRQSFGYCMLQGSSTLLWYPANSTSYYTMTKQ